MIVTLRQNGASCDIDYFVSVFVAMPTFVICAACSVSINAINFCTGNSRSGRMTTATSGFVRFNSTSRERSVCLSTASLLNRIVSCRSIEIVCTCAGSTGRFAAPLDGITRFTLFSNNGVVIMKMIRRTKARSSNGVMLISDRVDRLCRCE